MIEMGSSSESYLHYDDNTLLGNGTLKTMQNKAAPNISLFLGCPIDSNQ
ncbi:hypothetical protein PT273_04880 [Orbaceae bacterium ESL0727]|nr:hypothetical protein [Orbaceae bacterium ESL0727]